MHYVPTLDGWRGLSVIGIILLHGQFFSNHLLRRVSMHGLTGVAVFFAVSGFLISHLLLKEFACTEHIDLQRFFLRRCCRIMPAYYAALLGVAILGATGTIQLNDSELPSCLLFYRSYMPLGMDEAGGYYTAHYWSLSVEAHFYLLWPLLITMAPRWAGKITFLLAMVVLGWRVMEPQMMADTRMDGLFWGCLAAIYLDRIRRWVRRWRLSQLSLPVAALVVISMLLRVSIAWHILLETILLPALILSTVLEPTSLLSRLLEWKPLTWVGSLSYSLYLWQQLFLPQLDPARGSFHNLQRQPWNLLATFVCACLSRCLVEIPAIRWARRVTQSSRFEQMPIHPRWIAK